MRKDKAARRSSKFNDLFAERQVYLRNGLTSRYLVLSRSLQIAATAGVLLILAGLALASYSSFAKQREVAEQRTALARLEGQNESLRAAAEAAAKETGALAARVPDLEAALAEAGAAREQTRSQAAAAGAEAARLRRELTLAGERIRALDARAAVATAADADAAEGAPGGPAGQVAAGERRIARLTEELDRARDQRDQLAARLEEEGSAAGQTVAQLTLQVETTAAETRRLRDALDERTAETERLRGDLAAAVAEAAALRSAADSTATALAELQAEMARAEQAELAGGEAAAADLAELKRSAEAAVEEAAGLKLTLASAEARIAALNADLESARSALATARQVPASAPAAGRREPPDAGTGGPERDLGARLAAANQRIEQLESALRQSLLYLAPAPAPPAPR